MATVRLQLRRGTAQQWEDADPTLAAGEIGIETDTNTFKFGDGNTPWTQLSYALSDTVDDYVLLSTKGQPLGVASLDASGFVPAAQLPPLAKVTVTAVADQSARLALTVEPGDIAIQSDNGTTYVLASSPASNNANWREISATAAISSAIDAHEADTTNVHGIADTSALATKSYADQAEADAISTASADATSKANAAQSAAASDATTKANAAQAAAEATAAADATSKANAAKSGAELTASNALSAHESDTTDIHGIPDTSILVTTTGTQTLTNKTITTPSGILKSDVGLSNVDNTSDLDKPISTLALQALGLKAPLESPALTGDATANNLTISGNLTVNGTTSTINSTTLTVQDKDIVLGQTQNPTDAGANDGGIILKGTTDKSIKYSLAKEAWESSENINLPGDKAIKINNIEVLTINSVLGKGLPGVVVGTTETQTLSGKTLTSPVINDPTINDAIMNAPTVNDPVITGVIALPSTVSIGNVSASEIALLEGSNSNIQDQIDTKAPVDSPTFTGTVSGITKAMVGLTSVDDTADLDKPISTATQTALDYKANLESPTFTGTVVLPSTTTIGSISATELELLDGVTSAIQTQIDSKAPSADPTFTGTVVLPATTSIGLVSATEIELLDGVTSNVQDQINAKAPSADPTFTGTVVLPATTSIGLVSATEIELLNGVTSNVQDQIDTKAPVDSPTFTGTVTLPANTISQTHLSDNAVGTAEIDGLAVTTAKIADSAVTESKLANDAVTTGKIAAGTILNSDISASAAIAQSKIDGLGAALDLKAPLESPTFTGTVSGVTKSMVDLANVDNTSDANKPVSTATQTALDLKANLAAPTFTGTVVLPSTTSIGDISSTEIGYINGVTSAIQTQIDGKASLSGATFTGSVEIDQNLTVDGNLTVTGTTTTVNTTNFTTADPLIYLGEGNNANLVDLGFVGSYNDGTYAHQGLAKDSSAGKWKLFKGVTDEPTTTINFAQGSLDDLEVAGFTASSISATSATIGDVSNTELQYLNGVTSGVQTQIDAKAPKADPTFTGTVTVGASGIAFTDGTQTKQGVPSLTTIGTEISADYNLSTGGLTLRDQLIPIAGTRAITVPTNATTAFPVGTSIDFYQSSGTGANFVEASGVTILRTPGLKLRTTYSSATLTKVATNTWLLAGDLSA